jgi:hypothetical protein
MMLAGGISSEILSQEAVIPEVPVIGAPAEWRQFAEDLRQNVALCWSRPRDDIRQGIEWVGDARNALAAADLRATEHRAQADRAARGRIEARTRLDSRMSEAEQALTHERSVMTEAAREVDAAAKERDDLDELYRSAVACLHGIGNGELDSVSPTDVLPTIARVRELLALRNELEQRLRGARDEERNACEEVALTLAQEVELRRVLADIELEEQDMGQRAELLAARTTDEVIGAQRAFENACLNLYLQYVRHAYVSMGGPVDASINLRAADLESTEFVPEE